MGVGAAGELRGEGALAQGVVVFGSVGVAREEGAGDDDEQQADVGEGEDCPVDEADDGALLVARRNIMCVN